MSILRDREALIVQKLQKRVRNAKSYVDTRPPRLPVAMAACLNHLQADRGTMVVHSRVNERLVINIANIFSTRGDIDSFPKRIETTYCGNRARLEANKRIQLANQKLAMRLATVKGELKTRYSEASMGMRRRRPRRFNVPYSLLSKYSTLNLPVGDELNRMLRPCIFFDLEIKDLRPLGRLVIQLYTEAAPLVVAEFMRVCTKCEHTNFRFVRLFPSLWLEGELKVDAEHERAINIERDYDMRALDNNSGPGILTYSKQHVDGFKPNLFSFAVSFKPLRVVNGRRIAFGRVVAGMDVLRCIETYGTKKGRANREILVAKCGVVCKGQAGAKKKKKKKRSIKLIKRTSADMRRMSKKPATVDVPTEVEK